MLGKRTRPVTGKFLEPTIPIEKTKFPDMNTSPKSPLDIKIRSPRGLRNCNPTGGVGLGIVAALEKSGNDQISKKFILGNLNLTRSDPIPIRSNSNKCRVGVRVQEPEMTCWDEYTTCVTKHGPNNKSCTKVYFDGGDDGMIDKRNFNGSGINSGAGAGRAAVMFHCSPQPEEYPTSSFLSACYLCRKELHGKDIYMYRGEKAFCSTECRYRQMVSDERKEKCRSEASRSVDISVSPYSGGQIFSTGIFAA